MTGPCFQRGSRWYRLRGTPNAEVVRAAKAHVYTLLDLLDRATMTGDTRTRLTAAASDAACLVGYGDLRRGRLDDADAWFTDALKLARQAGDRHLEAFGCGSFGVTVVRLSPEA